MSKSFAISYIDCSIVNNNEDIKSICVHPDKNVIDIYIMKYNQTFENKKILSFSRNTDKPGRSH